MGGGFYRKHREVIGAWREHAIVLYERWKWTPGDVDNLDVTDFAFYVEQAKKIFEAEAEAANG